MLHALQPCELVEWTLPSIVVYYTLDVCLYLFTEKRSYKSQDHTRPPEAGMRAINDQKMYMTIVDTSMAQKYIMIVILESKKG